MKLTNFPLIFVVMIFSLSCEKEDTINISEAKLLNVTLESGKVVINSTNHIVLLKMPESVDITKITPHFEISEGATIYPASDAVTDYSYPVIYTIMSRDKKVFYNFTVLAFHPVLRVTVYDCTTWSLVVPRTLQPGAIIKIYTIEEFVNTTNIFDVLISDNDGKAELYGPRGFLYYITVNKDNKTNIVNGYVLDGRYNNQQEVDSAFDPNATIGGFRFKDINGDGELRPDDKFNYDCIWVSESPSIIKSMDLYVADQN